MVIALIISYVFHCIKYFSPEDINVLSIFFRTKTVADFWCAHNVFWRAQNFFDVHKNPFKIHITQKNEKCTINTNNHTVKGLNRCIRWEKTFSFYGKKIQNLIHPPFCILLVKETILIHQKKESSLHSNFSFEIYEIFLSFFVLLTLIGGSNKSGGITTFWSKQCQKMRFGFQ